MCGCFNFVSVNSETENLFLNVLMWSEMDLESSETLRLGDLCIQLFMFSVVYLINLFPSLVYKCIIQCSVDSFSLTDSVTQCISLA